MFRVTRYEISFLQCVAGVNAISFNPDFCTHLAYSMAVCMFSIVLLCFHLKLKSVTDACVVVIIVKPSEATFHDVEWRFSTSVSSSIYCCLWSGIIDSDIVHLLMLNSIHSKLYYSNSLSGQSLNCWYACILLVHNYILYIVYLDKVIQVCIVLFCL